MKRLFKWFFRLVLIVVGIVAVLVLLRNPLLRAILEHRLTAFTGLETVIGGVDVELRQPRVTLRDVRLLNPPSLSTRPFLDISRARVEYAPQHLLARELHILSLDLQVEAVQLFRKDTGRSTQMVLARNLALAQADGRTPLGLVALQPVGTLRVSVGRYAYLDYVQMNMSQEVTLGLTNLVFTNVSSLAELRRALGPVAEQKGVRWPPLDGPGAAAGGGAGR